VAAVADRQPDRAVRVSVQSATKRRDLPSRQLVGRWVAAAVAGHGRAAAGQVTVRFVGRREGQLANETWRGKTGPTNVLAFPGPPPALAGDEPELGDLVICLPVVAAEARAQGKRSRDHLAHLVVHGTLHLLGHDHQRPAAARRMEQLEKRVLAGLGLPDPYAAEHVR
jgi:probable rRNA maturation factor